MFLDNLIITGARAMSTITIEINDPKGVIPKK